MIWLVTTLVVVEHGWPAPTRIVAWTILALDMQPQQQAQHAAVQPGHPLFVPAGSVQLGTGGGLAGAGGLPSPTNFGESAVIILA
jgi:hypothetical protein